MSGAGSRSPGVPGNKQSKQNLTVGPAQTFLQLPLQSRECRGSEARFLLDGLVIKQPARLGLEFLLLCLKFHVL